jgi:hypothetical protein
MAVRPIELMRERVKRARSDSDTAFFSTCCMQANLLFDWLLPLSSLQSTMTANVIDIGYCTVSFARTELANGVVP